MDTKMDLDQSREKAAKGISSLTRIMANIREGDKIYMQSPAP